MINFIIFSPFLNLFPLGGNKLCDDAINHTDNSVTDIERSKENIQEAEVISVHSVFKINVTHNHEYVNTEPHEYLVIDSHFVGFWV